MVKCGLVPKAKQVFSMAGFGPEGERKRDVVLWTSMLYVYGRNGHFKEVIRLYNKMLMEGIKPDGVAFATVISTCGHTGQVNLGIDYFESMVYDFGLDPTSEHYRRRKIGIYVFLSNMFAKYGMWNEIGKLREEKKERELEKDAGCSWIEVAS
ncbi:hypothetical protein C3L33_19849, partial [Rhododendron williamsianum]